ncbi:negative elongation factor B isoform X1 [Neodiprion pinetum]|uniref:Negative elongation factor B n=2 Tax=Neodiprion lecontei TaxID=441921 RepID=A0A6J0BL74_NEOLC|nr:negative elongation factor B isoform X1 [Neodiprion lecontei]XP_015514539.1 negative elongation factor B isoform X1 [Neodiprion lecontei]XP_046412905.1 negative elongation factor B isoform X1 [Neodiprion fabricii]XP_046468412.1 negative elongation factor B isoform X1 [Neodiprion pinetum]XP_046468413.1 negative elongation factor B isoform X1 [Neodiprion pinetum]XP_046468414.1 negative elongation factor B isoform X1 [Neodiprion pinetum]XP_046468415.1 negative elongation factor B isoform X1 [
MSATKSTEGTGLEDLGVPGQVFLRDALTSCTDPLKAIEEFQLENGILLPSLRPMLPLLDLHGVRRLDFHASVLEELREKLVKRIAEIGAERGEKGGSDRRLKDLLAKSFPAVRVAALRPVVMCILRNTPHIDDKYLRVLVREKELYNDADTEVKRQIWKDNQSLFGDEVSPLFSRYIIEKEQVLFDHRNLNALFFSPSPKVRRQGEVVQKLAHMIGHSVKLYDMVLQFLRTLFLRTKNIHYCTLRAELLMALHDLEVQDIISVDPCHKFTWCLDACIREKNVDVKRSRELQGFLDSIKRGQEQVLGDLSMTLCDPYAVNFLASSAIKIALHLINGEALPRDNAVLVLLLRMLALGLSAWQMIDSQDFKEPKLDSQVVTKFLPALMSLMVDDQIRQLNGKLPPDERESAIAIIEHSGPPPDACQAYAQLSGVAAVLSMYHALYVGGGGSGSSGRARGDARGLMRVLATLPNCQAHRAFEDPFLHTLVSLLILNMADEFSGESFCTVIFDEFFLAGLTRDNVTRHLLKLLWYIHPKLPPARLHSLMKALQPNSQHNEAVHSLYQSLREKIGSQSTEDLLISSTSMDTLECPDSPLDVVPTPGPR